MVNQSLIAKLSVEEQEAIDMLAAEFCQTVADGDMESLVGDQIQELNLGTILQCTIIGYAGDDLLVDDHRKS